MRCARYRSAGAVMTANSQFSVPSVTKFSFSEELHMIDFTDQAATVRGGGRGLGPLYALELAKRGASVVVNDLGGSMHGDGEDASVADAVVKEIADAGGRAVASYHSVDTPEGGAAIVHTGLEAF